MLYASNSPVNSAAQERYINANTLPPSNSSDSPFLNYCTVCDIQLDSANHLYCSEACRHKDSTSSKDLPSLALLCASAGPCNEEGDNMHEDELVLSPGRFNTSIFDLDDSIVGLGFRGSGHSTATNGGDSGLPPSPTDVSMHPDELLSARGKFSPLTSPVSDDEVDENRDSYYFDQPSSELNRHSTAFSDLIGPRGGSFTTTAISSSSRKRISAPLYHQAASPLLSSSTTRSGRRQSFYVRPGGNSSTTYFDTTLTTTPTTTSATSTVTTATTTSSRTSDRGSIYAADTIDVPLKRTSSASIYPDSPRSISLVLPSTTPIQQPPAELEYEFPRIIRTQPTKNGVDTLRTVQNVDLVDSVNNHHNHAAFF
ncbi:hypothetical protein TRVA0_028S00980 [Trichomonascus vanleenenianus]|uniref:uncharacterized protein n=1 Tax=Trichomonascus vanleenenianus TaxID=2268995 RepID=UPI003ECA7C75